MRCEGQTPLDAKVPLKNLLSLQITGPLAPLRGTWGHGFDPGTRHTKVVNPYQPSVPFFGYRQTVQTQIRRPRTRRLIRVFTVCWQEFLSKIKQKWKSTRDTPKIGNGLLQLIRMEKSTRTEMKKYTRHPENWKWTPPVDKDGKVHWAKMSLVAPRLAHRLTG